MRPFLDLENHQYNKKIFLFLGLFILFFFYFWDLGNLDGLRQGTEGFYLQVLKEMYQDNSILTPRYVGLNHWSKPPFHFWIGLLSYFITGSPSLWAARASVALFSLGGLFYLSTWVKRHFDIPKWITIIFLGSSIGFLKYSRIYMMEVPLTLLSVLSVLKFYDFFKYKKQKDFWISSSLLALATLVKGPVSLVMGFGGVGLYLSLYFLRDRNVAWIKPFVYWILISVSFSSIWFVLSYLVHGQEFIRTFFIEQNLGKFKSQSYPIRVLFQGLFIFSLPWILFLPLSIKRIVQILKKEIKSKDSGPILFLVINFLVFFLLWCIPSQRSHHYAFPSIPFLLILILITGFKNLKRANIVFKIIGSFCFLLILLGLSPLFFKEFQTGNAGLLKIIITEVILIFCLIALWKKEGFVIKLISPILILGTLWTVFAPLFFLSYIPQNISAFIGDQDLGVVVRKPYFVREAVKSKKIDIIDPAKINGYIQAHSHLYLVHQPTYNDQKLGEVSTILRSWKIWKRGNTFSDIVNAFQKGTLTPLKENLLLLGNKK